MAKRCRRRSRSAFGPACPMSSPSKSTWPAVGSTSRVRQRTNVDLPEPESPITTKTSLRRTVKETSRTAATQPVRALSCGLESSVSSTLSTTRCGFGPKTFHRPRMSRTVPASPGTVAGSGVRRRVRAVRGARDGRSVVVTVRPPPQGVAEPVRQDLFDEGDQDGLHRLAGAGVALHDRHVVADPQRLADLLEVEPGRVVEGVDREHERHAALLEVVDGREAVLDPAGVDEDHRAERAVDQVVPEEREAVLPGVPKR